MKRNSRKQFRKQSIYNQSLCFRKPGSNDAILIFQNGVLGDFITILGLAQYVKDHEELPICLLTTSNFGGFLNNFCGEKALFKSVFFYDAKKFNTDAAYNKQFFEQFNGYHFKKILVTGSVRNIDSDLAVLALNGDSCSIISDEHFGVNRLLKHKMNNRFSFVFHTKRLMSRQEKLRGLMRGAGYSDYCVALPSVSVKNNSPEKKFFVSMVPFSSSKTKNWPLNNYLSLARELYVEYGVETLFLGKAEKDQMAQIPECDGIINKLNSTSTSEFVDLIGESLVCVGNDSACAHISVATKTPSICLLGGVAGFEFFPYKDCSNRPVPYQIIEYSWPRCSNCNAKHKLIHFFRCESKGIERCIAKIPYSQVRDHLLALVWLRLRPQS